MRTTRGIVIAGLFIVVACEKDPRSEVAPIAALPIVATAPRPAPPAPAISARLEEATLVAPPVREVPARTAPRQVTVPAPSGPLPAPPSMVPAEYKMWLEEQTREDQKRIAVFCGKHRLSLEAECGGIGPLHKLQIG